ncbi:MAG: phosphoenolpyruvate carboxykinase domain-containing protein, partial [Thermodesulfobacteriota bacterium]
PIGIAPRYEDIYWTGLEDFSPQKFEELVRLDTEKWKSELLSHEKLFAMLSDKLPKELISIREQILSNLRESH